ncbi:hypothetical protein C8J57DRAFT_1280232, partial [Mycena rebaudengoi]
MTSALTRLTENMALLTQSLEDVWFLYRLCSRGPCDWEISESSVCLMDYLFTCTLFHIMISNESML